MSVEAMKQSIEQAEKNDFNPDWDQMAILVEENQRLAKQLSEIKDWEAVAADQAMTIAMLKAEQKPICPHCKTKMTPVNDLSDYSPSAYWQCECETLPNAEIDYGKYSGF